MESRNIVLKKQYTLSVSGGGGGTPYNVLYEKAFSDFRVGILPVEVYKRVGKSVIWVCERDQKG